jgi:sortase A
MVLGLGLLIYVSAQYGLMVYQQRRLAREWERQNQAATSSVGAPQERPASDGLTRISIARINLDAVVVEGASRKQLMIGPGHITESALPGAAGNAVITAHRDTFFRHIYELNQGDLIELRRDGNTYRYEVTGKRVVDPSDLSVLKPTADARLTLITCFPTYYVGPAPERLVVFSKLVEGPANQQAHAATP